MDGTFVCMVLTLGLPCSQKRIKKEKEKKKKGSDLGLPCIGYIFREMSLIFILICCIFASEE